MPAPFNRHAVRNVPAQMPPGPDPDRENHAPLACAHCGSPVPEALSGRGYCCAGCEAVSQLLRHEGLGRYYDLAGRKTLPIGGAPSPQTHTWLEPLLAQATDASGGSDVCSVELDVQGIHCAGCVWLINETFRRTPGAVAATVNPAVGKVRLVFRKSLANINTWVNAVERFGYRFGPSRKRGAAATASLTWRLGLCVALSMNVMLMSISFYFGLAAGDETLFPLFTWLSVLLSGGVVVIGGEPFFRAAWFGLRRGVLALDLPMALGIVLVFTTSVVQVMAGRGGDLTYFDTLNVFVTLMVLGRWLQQKVMDRNRTLLLQDDGAEGLFVRRLQANGPVAVRAPELKRDDHLLVAPGEVVPVDAILLSDQAQVSLDWITGESRPLSLAKGQALQAGSCNVGCEAITAQARTDFADSPLSRLLRAPPPSAGPAKVLLWDRLARAWAVSVLALASIGFLVWRFISPAQALDVTVALLVVTCPCAIGISLPLARELVHLRLRRLGLFPRDVGLLDKLLNTRKIIFDKTGTLTLGRLDLAAPEALAGCPDHIRNRAYTLACQSAHPVANCIASGLRHIGAHWEPSLKVIETPGQGLSARTQEGEWRLGKACYALADLGGHGGTDATVLSCDGRLVAQFETREVLRADAAQSLRRLRALGCEVFLMSGDQPERVSKMARQLDLPDACAFGGLSPEDKAAHVLALDQSDTLYVGDGVNDTLAFDRANVAGTVAVDRPILPGKAQFYMLGEGLDALAAALAGARSLRRVSKRVIALSVTYNVFAVAACLAGAMTPLRAAVSMPASSLFLLAFTLWSLGPKRSQTPQHVGGLVEATCS